MGRNASVQRCALLVPVVDIEVYVAVTVDVGKSVVEVVVLEGVEMVVLDGVGGLAVVQLEPEHFKTATSAQFQNFSAPLLLVLGSTTFEGHEDIAGFHHAPASPPKCEVIHDCVELLPKYSASPAGLQELAVTQNH